jgi:hypothetical protein
MTGLMTPEQWAAERDLQVLAAPGAASITTEDRQYRYWLSRTWSDAAPPMPWVMLNPSQADVLDDATIRRCKRFARDHGAGGIEVTNLFALRSTTPAALRTHADPVGPYGNAALALLARRARCVVVAWGATGDTSETVRRRADDVLLYLADREVRLYCLGTTTAGHPRHPLRLAVDTPLVPYEAVTDAR